MPSRDPYPKTYRKNAGWKWMLCIISIALVTIFASARPHLSYGSVPQGGSGTFTADGTQSSQSDDHWEIIGPDGSVQGRKARPQGWGVTFDGSNFTITAPTGAEIADNYLVRYRTGQSFAGGASGSFGVTPDAGGNPTTTGTTSTGTTSTGTTTGGSPPPSNLVAVPQQAQIALTWTSTYSPVSFKLYRGTTVGTYTQIYSGTASNYVDTSVILGYTYYYVVTQSDTLGVSGYSTVASASTAALPTLFYSIQDIEETRSHVLTMDATLVNSAPAITLGQCTYNGQTETVNAVFLNAITSDTSLNDALTTTVTSPTSWSGSVQDNGYTGHPTLSCSGFEVTASPYPITMTFSSSGGAGRAVDVILYYYYLSHVSGGMVVNDGTVSGIPSVAPFLQQRWDYNAVKANADIASVDSRRFYGVGNLPGEAFADINAPPRNPNFYGDVYNGGIFAGNSPSNGSDQSGTARVQLYLGSLPNFTNVIWQDLVLCYLGNANGFASDANYNVSIPSTGDSNLGTLPAVVTWATRWNLSTATPQTALNVGSLTSGQYANFQLNTLAPKMILSLVNETSDISGFIPDWRYFATPGYASASGLISVTDAQPHAWILDQTWTGN